MQFPVLPRSFCPVLSPPLVFVLMSLHQKGMLEISPGQAGNPIRDNETKQPHQTIFPIRKMHNPPGQESGTKIPDRPMNEVETIRNAPKFSQYSQASELCYRSGVKANGNQKQNTVEEGNHRVPDGLRDRVIWIGIAPPDYSDPEQKRQ